jgi:glycosyltransferase involved in cell wall biosynthesis
MTERRFGENFDPLTNYGPQPLVTTVIVTHPGDVALLRRATDSLREQLPAGQLEVIIMHDGPIEGESTKYIEGLPKDYDFALEVVATPEHSGYYTVARNRSMEIARGLYISHMDADNEFAPGHLLGLLRGLRVPDPETGWDHFAYSRRLYVKDPGVEATVPEGPSPFIPWTQESLRSVMAGPKFNFIDTGDMLIGRSVLFQLAEKTGYVWNSNSRRFGDHDLVYRMMACGFRGRAVDQVTNIYHWTGKNLQLTRGLSELMVIPSEIYDKLKAEGKLT